MKNVDEYKTKDFYTAAFIASRGHKILHIQREDPKRVFFVFDNFEGREDLIRAFLFGKAAVEPQAFIAAIKTLKGLIYSND